MAPKIGQKLRLAATIAISSAFFVSELAGLFAFIYFYCHFVSSFDLSKISFVEMTRGQVADNNLTVAFKTGSLALTADAFHYVLL